MEEVEKKGGRGRLERKRQRGEKSWNHALFICKNPIPAQGLCPRAFVLASTMPDTKSMNQTITCACWTKPHTTWVQECCQGDFTLGSWAWRKGTRTCLCIGRILRAPRVLTHRVVGRPEKCTMSLEGDLGSTIWDFKHATSNLDLWKIRS